MKKHLIVAVLLLNALPFVAQVLPYQNSSLPSEARAKDLLSRLTLAEKVSLMTDQSQAVPRLGIKAFNWWSEALHGLANNNNVTVFPEPVGMAASFDDELVYRVFEAASDETRAKYNEALRTGLGNRRFLSLSVWTPNINIFRDPRWGRGQETYGEDPYLTSRMGISVVKGLQGPADAKYRKLLACAKHFAVHSGPEWSRHTLNINNLDPRDLYETYLPAFKALVQQADVREVMCAYQRLDDEPCCGSTRLLQRILREDWGYKYLVVSDCDAVNDFHLNHKTSSDPVHSAANAVMTGTDVECAWKDYTYKNLNDAAAKGLIREADINQNLQRVLFGRFELGEMDDDALVPWAKIPMTVVNNEAHRTLALDMARETMTLLQNNNQALPLSKSTKKVAVIGPNADEEFVLWGNYNGTPIRTITVLDGIKTKLSANNIVYDMGCDWAEDKTLNSCVPLCTVDGKSGFKITYWNGLDCKGTPVATQYLAGPLKLMAVDGSGFKVAGLLPAGFSALFETQFTATATEELVFRYSVCGSIDLLINGQSVRKDNNWRILPGKVYYSVEKGKTYTVQLRFNQQDNWEAGLLLDFGSESPVDFSGLLKKLEGIEQVVFVGGLSSRLEGEEMTAVYPGFKGGDRTSIELPAIQRNCLKALKAAGKKVIFVNCSGSAIALVPETQSCEAILQAWYPGESGGQAVADVLFGDYNPSGKLSVTFYKNDDQLKGFEDYSMKGRTYRYMEKNV